MRRAGAGRSRDGALGGLWETRPPRTHACPLRAPKEEEKTPQAFSRPLIPIRRRELNTEHQRSSCNNQDVCNRRKGEKTSQRLSIWMVVHVATGMNTR